MVFVGCGGFWFSRLTESLLDSILCAGVFTSKENEKCVVLVGWCSFNVAKADYVRLRAQATLFIG